MQGELDQIFKNYKQGKQQEYKPIKPIKKSSFFDQREVPTPFIDGENEIDCSSISTCNKCGSFNISTDMSTNKIVCLDCGNNPDNPTRVDFQKMMEKKKEEEQEKIIESLKRGDVFLK